jgi:hypothetical protein
MANTISSTNMGLPIPVVGTDPGPDWATDINSCLTLIDQHDHSVGYGVQITPAGLSINSDLTFQSNNATNLRTVRLASQTTTLSLSTDKGCLYEVVNDLYYNDGAGTAIRLTQSGAVAGTPGSISNLVSPASAAYVSATQTFVFQQAANTPANVDGASFIFRNTTASSKGVTVSAPGSLAADYALSFPTSLPASTLPVSLSAAGAFSAAQITAAQIASGTITATQIASGTITTTQIASATIVSANIAAATVAGSNIVSNVSLAGTNILAASRSIATATQNLGGSASIIVGGVTAGGGVSLGWGFTVTHSAGTGLYTINFSPTFGSTPSVVATPNGGATNFYVKTDTLGTASVLIQFTTSAGSTSVETDFTFMAIGTR